MSDILRWKSVKTNKPHNCWGCGKEYPPKTQMISAAYADGGSAMGCYWCETCIEYMRRYFEPGDEAEYGAIYDGNPEQWNEINGQLSPNEREGS